jgi:hypothetical protein
LEHETGGGEPADRSSDRDRGGGLVAQETTMVVTFALPTVPEPPETVQVCPDAWEKTVTE